MKSNTGQRVYPVAGLEEANEPETDIDVEEEYGVGQDEGVSIAPIP